MANPSYNYFAFIDPSSDADLATLKIKLDAFYDKLSEESQPVISLDGERITLAFGDYPFYIYLADEPYVLVEAIEISNDHEVDWNDEPYDKDRLRTCTRRLEVWGGADYDLDYFNDSLFIIQTIEEFDGVLIFALY